MGPSGSSESEEKWTSWPVVGVSGSRENPALGGALTHSSVLTVVDSGVAAWLVAVSEMAFRPNALYEYCAVAVAGVGAPASPKLQLNVPVAPAGPPQSVTFAVTVTCCPTLGRVGGLVQLTSMSTVGAAAR